MGESFTKTIIEILGNDLHKEMKVFCTDENNAEVTLEPSMCELPEEISYNCPIANACIYYNAIKSFNIVVEKKFPTDLQDSWGRSCAHFAAQFGRMNFISDDHFKDINMHVTDRRQRSPLHYAAEFGFIDIVQHLVNNVHLDINSTDRFGVSALHLACKNGHVDIVKYLRDKNAEVKSDNYNNLPVHYAIRGNHSEVLNFFELNSVDQNGRNLMHFAGMACADKCIPILKDHCDMKLLDSIGMTPAHYAAENNGIETFKAIINAGCNVNIKTSKGFTPLHFVARSNHKELCSIITQIQGVQVDAVDSNGQTPLHFAAAYSAFYVIPILLHAHARADVADKNGKKPLDCCQGPFASECADLIKGMHVTVSDICSPSRCPVYSQATTASSNAGNNCIIL